MDEPPNGFKWHEFLVNVGLFCSGSTTLVEAAKRLGLKAYRAFSNLSQSVQ